MRILVTDSIDPDGVALLRAESRFTIDEVPTLPQAELLERIGDYDALIGRSATRITDELLRRAKRLRVIGRAGVGVDNIALSSATQLGVAVINAPAGNTNAVVELVFGSLIGLLRHIPRAAESMRAGRWDRSKLLGNELRGRALGIIGVGRIGSEVAVRAHAFGMDVVGYDPYVNDERFRALRVRRAWALDQLLDEAEIVTIHTPLTEETEGMIGSAELARLRPGAVVANLARGGIVVEDALIASLSKGHLRGAVLDVYSTEPLSADSPLRTLPNVLLMPHIGASSAEAQRNVAVDVCRDVRDALLTGELSRSINVPWAGEGRWAELRTSIIRPPGAPPPARRPRAAGGGPAPRRLSVRTGEELAGAREMLASAAALGVLHDIIETERLNLINARALAEARGIELALGEISEPEQPTQIEVSLDGGTQDMCVAGAAPPGVTPRISRIGAFHVDVAPRNTLIILTNNDVPGVIGRVGTLLGDAGVNIAEYHQARLAQGGEALATISVDSIVTPELRRRLLDIPEVMTATVVRFDDAVSHARA